MQISFLSKRLPSCSANAAAAALLHLLSQQKRRRQLKSSLGAAIIHEIASRAQWRSVKRFLHHAPFFFSSLLLLAAACVMHHIIVTTGLRNIAISGLRDLETAASLVVEGEFT